MTETETRAGMPSEGERPPDLSVVVPSVNGSHDLLDCLDALFRQTGDLRLEVLVPERCGHAVRDLARERFPDALVMPVDPGTPIPEMRRRAFQAATADSVAVIEDHVLVPPDWAASLLAARREGHPVVGGWVVNAATDRLVDRAAFLCEYSPMLERGTPGPALGLTGNNVVYDRRLLVEHMDVIEEGRWEDRLHDALRASGVQLVCRPEIEVRHRMRYRSAREYASQRFLYSRAYAGMRASRMGPLARVAYGVATLSLPPVLLARILKRGWSSPAARADLVRSSPLLVFFVTSWALGETAGALLGPGDALGQVR